MRLTFAQKSLLRAAEAKSLPGDGHRIRGSGSSRAARRLEELGLVRVARIYCDGAYLHVTPAGRELVRQMPGGIAGPPPTEPQGGTP
jgi:hypothetical protein